MLHLQDLGTVGILRRLGSWGGVKIFQRNHTDYIVGGVVVWVCMGREQTHYGRTVSGIGCDSAARDDWLNPW